VHRTPRHMYAQVFDAAADRVRESSRGHARHDADDAVSW
jgi:ribosomal protein L18